MALSYYNLREVTVAGVHLVIFSTSKITLLLKIIYMLTNFLILSNTLPFKYCSLNMYFEGNLDSANKYNVIMTSIYVIVSIKLCHDEYFVLCNFGGRSLSGFEVIEGGLWSLPRS